jgi:hypothetical protein
MICVKNYKNYLVPRSLFLTYYKISTKCQPTFPGSTEYTEWQRPLYGVQAIMMEKLAQAGEGGGAPYHIYHHIKSCSVRFS